MGTTPAVDPAVPGSRVARAAKVIIVGSVMFTFISSWRTAAVVLCDLASTAYYIGGIVEQSIGPAAPWFILAVMVFSYAVRAVYIESCSMFVRGGVYRVVREAMGQFSAKLAVSALIFDYILTGPISTVSAGQYLIGLGLESLNLLSPDEPLVGAAIAEMVRNWGSVALACAVTIYFFRQNIRGIHESSDKALKIMIVTTIMGVIILIWCGVTLAVQGPANDSIPWQPRLERGTNVNPVTGEVEDPLGFLPHMLPETWQEAIRHPASWFSIFGAVGLMIAFGHSILAMSGEETLAQVYREVESPKLENFKKAAFIVFIYSLILTAGISFLAVLLIPSDVRMSKYSENLINGLAMNVIGPLPAKLLLSAFVTIVGFLILSGACNTSLIGANGVLNRVAEDGILADWFRKPHPKFGTTYRILVMITVLQIITIIASRGNVYILGEAYAFGVVWSFAFQAISMVVLRFKDRRPRAFKVPLNFTWRGVEVPVGLIIILVFLLSAAVLNFFTKELATIGGLVFGGAFFTLFTISERWHKAQRQGGAHQHLEQFNPDTVDELSLANLHLHKPYRKLVAIRSPQNLYMLEKALAETDQETTDVIVMTAKMLAANDQHSSADDLDKYDQELMTAVVTVAERAGQEVTPLIVPTNNPFHAVIQTARQLQAQEIIMGASNVYTAEEQLDQVSLYWLNLWGGQPTPLTVRLLNRERDIYFDLAGGNRIPTAGERKARTVADLRAAGVGVERVLLISDGGPASSDLFESVLTMLDPQVSLDIAPLVPPGNDLEFNQTAIKQDQVKAQQLGRTVLVHDIQGDPGPVIAKLAQDLQYQLVIIPLADEPLVAGKLPLPAWVEYVLAHAHCRVLLTKPPRIPREIIDQPRK